MDVATAVCVDLQSTHVQTPRSDECLFYFIYQCTPNLKPMLCTASPRAFIPEGNVLGSG